MSQDTRSAPFPSGPDAAAPTPRAPYLITRPHAEVPLAQPAVRFQGRFGYEKIHARTGLVTASGEFDNLITNVGLDALGNTSVGALVATLAVGIGLDDGTVTPPAVTDTALNHEIERTGANGGFADESGYDTTDPTKPFHWYRKVFLFTEGQANANLKELGTFSSGGVLWNRQLFRDANGNSVVVTKTSDEQLKLYYEWRVYPPTTSTTQTLTVGGVDITVTNRAYKVTDYYTWGGFGVLGSFGNAWGLYGQLFESNAMPAAGSPQGGSSWAPNVSTISAYTGGNLYRDGELTWNPSNANSASGKLGSLTLSWSSSYNPPFISTFTPQLTKTVNDRVIIQARISWTRATV